MERPIRVFAYMRLARSPRAWIYGRVASPGAFALRMQQEHLTSYADRNCYEVVGITVEQGSGITMQRQGLNEVSEAAAQGLMEVLLVKNLDRLGRNAQKVGAYIQWLGKHGVEVICTDEPGSVRGYAEIYQSILSAFSKTGKRVCRD